MSFSSLRIETSHGKCVAEHLMRSAECDSLMPVIERCLKESF